ncbi:hypothetical protein PsorP6_011340 [Peronosclerospora sorghi]|uniref:Uncharacterized protein n=1 Tax=Peronosclerospora sorghi TaxID=230839 RepID=A0ACC0WKA3_9STRA|nr:hypothetical protein PsorP6_011340 [Peronosclerospora sorghi]
MTKVEPEFKEALWMQNRLLTQQRKPLSSGHVKKISDEQTIQLGRMKKWQQRRGRRRTRRNDR